MAKGSMLEHLQTIPDPRRGQGRVYPLGSILGMLVVAALNGECSLRGMWQWAEAHWGHIEEALGFPRHRGVTVRDVVERAGEAVGGGVDGGDS